MTSTVTIPQKEYQRLRKLERFVHSVPDIEELLETLEDVEALGAKRLPRLIARARRNRKTIPWENVKNAFRYNDTYYDAMARCFFSRRIPHVFAPAEAGAASYCFKT